MSEVDWDAIAGTEIDSVCYGKCIINIKAGELYVGILAGFIMEIDGILYYGNVDKMENCEFLIQLSSESLKSVEIVNDEVIITFSKSRLTLITDESPYESYSINYKGYNLFK